MALSVRARRMAVGGVVAAMVAFAAPALAGPNKPYTVDIAGTAVAGKPATFTVTLDAPAKQDLGSARLTVPVNWTVTSVVADTAEPPIISGRTITLNQLSIPAGGTKYVTVRASVGCTGAGSTWSVDAKQANDFNGEPGNVLQLDPASMLTTTVLGECVPCPEDSTAETCKATKGIGPTSLTVRGLPQAGGDNDEGQVSLAVNAGLSIECAGYVEYSADTALVDVVRRDGAVTISIPKNRLKGGALEVCFGSPKAFPGGQLSDSTFDWNGDGVPEPVYVGLLRDCGLIPVDVGPQPCVSFRSKAGDLIEARLPEGDPGMRG